MSELFQKSANISNKNEIGLPFGKSYYKPTPKTWRVIGDSLLTASLIVTALGAAISFPPIVIAIAGSAGIAGKFITNCISAK